VNLCVPKKWGGTEAKGEYFAKIEDLRLHDLRRTLASYMAMDNQSLQIIGKALGHKSVASTQIYSRLMNDPVRKAMESAQEQIKLLGNF
jgi:integrase